MAHKAAAARAQGIKVVEGRKAEDLIAAAIKHEAGCAAHHMMLEGRPKAQKMAKALVEKGKQALANDILVLGKSPKWRFVFRPTGVTKAATVEVSFIDETNYKYKVELPEDFPKRVKADDAFEFGSRYNA
jgi:hypothetical protein